MKYFISVVFLLFFTGKEMAGQSIALPDKLSSEIPYDLAELAKAPEFKWENKKQPVWSLLYKGELFKGKNTEVFAYYASPATIAGKKAKGQKYPGIVLVHGGGGTAYKNWVKTWAERGYAAIAMDLDGARPLPEHKDSEIWSVKTEPLENSGPNDNVEYKFYHISDTISNQWEFHAISNLIRAHSLLLSFKDTDTTRTAITGMSWGGYLTTIVSAIDKRYKAAVPIYGCGFLGEKGAFLKYLDSLEFEEARKWINLWDPSKYISEIEMPTLFVNGTNDLWYHVESWQKTIDRTPKAEQLLIPELPHDYAIGSSLPEIPIFIESVLNKHREVPQIRRPKKIGKWFQVDVENFSMLRKVLFVFTKDALRNRDRKWEVVPVSLDGNLIVVEITHDVKAAYFMVHYGDKEYRLSSPVIFN